LDLTGGYIVTSCGTNNNSLFPSRYPRCQWHSTLVLNWNFLHAWVCGMWPGCLVARPARGVVHIAQVFVALSVGCLARSRGVVGTSHGVLWHVAWGVVAHISLGCCGPSRGLLCRSCGFVATSRGVCGNVAGVFVGTLRVGFLCMSSGVLWHVALYHQHLGSIPLLLKYHVHLSYLVYNSDKFSVFIQPLPYLSIINGNRHLSQQLLPRRIQLWMPR